MNRLRKLGLLFALTLALTLVFTSVTAALASAHEWKIETKTLTELGLTSETVSSSGGPFTLESFIGSTAITIECTTETNTGTIVRGGTDTASIIFSSCKLTKPVLPACSVPNIAATAKTELITASSKLYDKFLPLTVGGTFATVKIVGEVCALKGSYPVNGTTAGYDPLLSTEADSHTLQFSGPVSSEAGTALTFGGKAAILKGDSTEVLSGPHTGDTFSGS